MRIRHKVWAAAAAAGLTVVGLASAPATHTQRFEIDAMRTRTGAGTEHATGPTRLRASRTKSGVPQNGISYHNGPVMTATKDAYVIWYGNWSGATVAPSSNPTAQALIGSMLSNLGGSPYFNINTTYVNGSLVKVSNAVALKGQASDSYSQGTSLSDAGVQAVVNRALSTGALPQDSNGVYFVLTSGDVSESSGFLSKYCGWHTAESYNGGLLQYSFVGDPAANINACSNQYPGPNGTSVGNADAMVSVIAHELEESATDPQLNAWYDSQGNENADKCAWTFGTTSKATNGASYNMTLGGTEYLIQRNWVNASGGYCGLSY